MTGTRAEQAARTRQRIVDAAERLFAARGYAATSLADVAGAVGIAKGNLHYHFRTKAELLDAAMLSGVRSVHDLLVAAARVPAGEERIRFLLNGYVDLLVTHRRRSTWVGSGPVAARERAARAFLEQLTTRAVALVSDAPLTPLHQLLISQVLALQDAVPRLTELSDDDLRVLLRTVVEQLLQLDPSAPVHSL